MPSGLHCYGASQKGMDTCCVIPWQGGQHQPPGRHRDVGMKRISAVFGQQDLWETAQRPVLLGRCMTGFTALISGVIRLQAMTLAEFALNLIFIVSWNGNCFLPVNKAVGALPYNGGEQTITVCFGPLTAGHTYQWRFWRYRNFISPRASSLSMSAFLLLQRKGSGYFKQRESSKSLKFKNTPGRERTIGSVSESILTSKPSSQSSQETATGNLLLKETLMKCTALPGRRACLQQNHYQLRDRKMISPFSYVL